MQLIKPTILTSHRVQLEPLREEHRHSLYDAAQNEAIWTFSPSDGYGENFHPWFDKAIEASKLLSQYTFAVRHLADNRIIGSSRYYDIDIQNKRCSIGYTWYVPEYWGTDVNPACKLLMLTHAFEELDFNRVQFSVDSRNTRSGAALEKIGAVNEGTLRQHIILKDGYVRDSIIYSILKSEWKTAKEKLLDRVTR